MTVALQQVGPADGTAHLAGTVVAALRGVRLPDGTLGDVLLDGETVTSAAARPGAGADLDARGWRVLPAACEPHAHLDKALTAPRLPPGVGNDLVAACDSWRVLLPAIDRADVETRALTAVRRYVARGITAIRTHVDLHAGPYPFQAVDALIGLRDRLRGRVTLQICLLAGHETPTELVAAAVARGVDVMGGCPHLAPDPRFECRRMLDVAEAHDLPVDLHVDEVTNVELADADLDIVELARQTLARGLARPVTASHAVRLGMLPPSRLAPVLAEVARAGLGVVTLPITNLYLQGRDATHAAPRGLTALHAILAAGIPLAAGADNVPRPLQPRRSRRPLRDDLLLQTAGHLTADQALHAVTAAARAVLGLPPAGVAPGDVADLLLVPDVDLGDVLAGTEDARIVLSGGRVVADTRIQRRLEV